MSKIQSYAKRELDILVKSTPNSIVKDLVPELSALCEKFDKLFQGGVLNPLTIKAESQASTLSKVVKHLCLLEPISPIMGTDDEWDDISKWLEKKPGYKFQNNRCSFIFKNGKDEQAYYSQAIIFKVGKTKTFIGSGSVTLEGEIIDSIQNIKTFPFTPRTFYIDVIQTEYSDKNKTVEKEGGGVWSTKIKDPKQLDEVFEYYDQKKPK